MVIWSLLIRWGSVSRKNPLPRASPLLSKSLHRCIFPLRLICPRPQHLANRHARPRPQHHVRLHAWNMQRNMQRPRLPLLNWPPQPFPAGILRVIVVPQLIWMLMR
ncbi:unnamed protein product [Linum trigynum]|uniref:Uncharacterized protein n=1 Tax=Linum trigynum TaxID=586398 RepID=A0AAV2DMX1_9ROSI